MAKHLPQSITDFLFTNLIEDYPVWDENTPYTFEPDENNLTSASVARYGNYYWRSTTNDNEGNIPIDAQGNVNDEWYKYEPSKIFSLLDLSAETEASKDGDDMILVFARNFNIETLVLGRFTASQIKIENLDDDDNVLATQIIEYSVNEFVVDYYTYMYSPYSEEVDRNVKIDIAPLGTKVRVTFVKQVTLDKAAAKFIVAGLEVDLGNTASGISTGFESYIPTEKDLFGANSTNSTIQRDIKGFDTWVLNTDKKRVERVAKNLKNEIGVYIIDPSDKSKIENEIILGQLENYNDLYNNFEKIKFNWSVKESV